MNTLTNTKCPILIDNSFSNLNYAINKYCTPDNFVIITDDNVDKLYYKQVYGILKNSGLPIYSIVITSGESSKQLKTVEGIYNKLAEFNIKRNDCVIALGGGVIGDISGFAASTYMRGIGLIQIPTTLIAQTDSSIGGKTGVNLDKFKNYIGTFYQPDFIYINTTTLNTLPRREFISGLSEVIKYGIIGNSELFKFLEQHNDKILDKDSFCLNCLVRESCKIKLSIVEQDFSDKGIRQLLNFGHTIGHALETESDFKLFHGECVGLGIIAESKIALERNLIDKNFYLKILNIINRFGLPMKHDFDEEKVFKLLKKDKKAQNKKVKFILPTLDNHPIITEDVTEEEIKKSFVEIVYK